jgi:hypothetical protein
MRIGLGLRHGSRWSSIRKETSDETLFDLDGADQRPIRRQRLSVTKRGPVQNANEADTFAQKIGQRGNTMGGGS